MAAGADHHNAYLQFLNDLDSAVEKAYMYAIHYPTLNSYADIDGHTTHWVECWNEYNKNIFFNLSLLKAAFGYVVESLATMIYLPAPPSGYSAELQGIRDATRPDVVLKYNGVDIGWLDITAENCAGHIWNKSGWNNKQIHVGEVAYPSLDLSLVKDNIKHDRSYDDKTDKSEVLSRVNYFKFVRAVRQRHWRRIGERYFNDPLKSNNEEHKRRYIRKRVADYLNLDYAALPPKTLGSVLYAMGVGATKHGYKDKHAIKGITRALGESILQQHDRELGGVENYTPDLANGLSKMPLDEVAENAVKASGNSNFVTPQDPDFLEHLGGASNGDELLALNERPENNDLVALGDDSTKSDLTRTHERAFKFIGTRLNPDYAGLHMLDSMMKKEMAESGLSKIKVAIKLLDGRVIVSEMGLSNFITFKMFAEGAEQRKKDRQESLRSKRKGFYKALTEAQAIPRPLSISPYQNLVLDESTLQALKSLGPAEIFAVMFQEKDGRETLTGDISGFGSYNFLE